MSPQVHTNQTVHVRIDARLRNYAKEEAARQQRSIRSLVEEALSEVLGSSKQESQK